MNGLTASISSMTSAGQAVPSPITRGESSFAGLLSQVKSSDDRRELLRQAAEQLVSSVFIAPILGGLREHSTAAGPFAPGVAERRFGPLLDQQFADRIVQGANLSLVDMIVERYLPAQNQQSQLLERTIA